MIYIILESRQMMLCAGSDKMIHPEQWCDSEPQCPGGEDENYCEGQINCTVNQTDLSYGNLMYFMVTVEKYL